ncbi:MAG TPA: MATE family efflux transporter [Trueperaceae bacterium]
MARLLALRRQLPIIKQVWILALPVIGANLLKTLVNIVDVFMAGRLGPVEIAAVGMSNTIRMLILVGIISVTAGSMALAAQARGARNPKQLSFVTRQSLSLTVLLGLGLSVIGWFLSEPLLAFLNSGGDPRAVSMGASYLKLLFVGTVFLNINFVISSLMQGAGDTLTPLYISGAVNILNIVFNSLFMFGPGPLPAFGVTGAAMGTVLARFFASAAGIWILYSGKNVIRILPGSFRPNWPMFRDLLSIGVPSGLQGIVRNTAQVLVLRIVTSTAAGTLGAAALAIGLQVESLAFMPGLALSVAATSLVGQAVGAWQVREAERRGRTALGLGILIMSAVALPVFFFAPQLVLLFDPSAQPVVVGAGTSYIRIMMLSEPILAVAMVANGALRGAGDTRPGLVGTLLGRWLVVVPLAWFLALSLGWGVDGVWWALFVGTAVQALWIFVRWQSNRWVGVALHKTPLYRRHLRRLPERVRARYLDEVRAPLMALPGMVEDVTADGVEYRSDERHVRVRFKVDDFELADAAEHEGMPAARHAAKPIPTAPRRRTRTYSR